MDPQRYLDFSDEDIEEEDQAFYKARLEVLSDREILPPVRFDWGLLFDIDIAPKLVKLLRRKISNNKGTLTIHPWFNMFTVQEPVYHELTLEFYSTVRVRATKYYPNKPPILEFRLGGEEL